MLGRIVALVASWALAFVWLSWGALPIRWRRTLALLTSGAGVLFLVLAIRAEGQHESPTVGVFLWGTPYVTAKVTAAASLPYYVVTGVLLVLGFVGLLAGDGPGLGLSRRCLANAVALSWLVSALRFVLEKSAAPESWTQLVGITSLAPVVGAYFALALKREGKGRRALLSSLLLYALAARGAVALLMLTTSALQLGTHYDVSSLGELRFLGRDYAFTPGSAGQILFVTLVSQGVFWPAYTVLSGMIGGGMARGLAWAWRRDVATRPAGALASAERP